MVEVEAELGIYTRTLATTDLTTDFDWIFSGMVKETGTCKKSIIFLSLSSFADYREPAETAAVKATAAAAAAPTMHATTMHIQHKYASSFRKRGIIFLDSDPTTSFKLP